MEDSWIPYHTLGRELTNLIREFFPGRNIKGKIDEGLDERRVPKIDLIPKFCLTVAKGIDQQLFEENKESFLRRMGEIASRRFMSMELDGSYTQGEGYSHYSYSIRKNN